MLAKNATVAPVNPRHAPADPEREALFAKLQPLVRRLLARYAAHLDAREDLERDIYERFCTLYGAYDPNRGIPLMGYMVRMLPQVVHTHMRSRWRRERREVPLEAVTETRPAYSREPTEDPTADWHEALDLQRFAEKLPAVLSRVPRRQRCVVIWRFYEGMSFEEIAERLEVKPATVRSLLRHGLANMRSQLAMSAAP